MAKGKSNLRKMEHSVEYRPAFQFQLEDVSLKDGMFRGLASVFGSEVQNPGFGWDMSIIEKGAFSKTIRERGSKVKLLWQHDSEQPVGIFPAIQETEVGLEVVGRLSDTERANEAKTLMRDGAIDGLSIGFDAIKWELVKRDGVTIRLLKEVKLWEISLVTFPADPRALIKEVAAQRIEQNGKCFAVDDSGHRLYFAERQHADDYASEKNLEVQEIEQMNASKVPDSPNGAEGQDDAEPEGREAHSIDGYAENGYTSSEPGSTSPAHLHDYYIWKDQDGQVSGHASSIADHGHRITASSFARGETEESDGHVHRLMTIDETLIMLGAKPKESQGIKPAEEPKEQSGSIIAFHDLPLLTRNQAWDAQSAEARVRRWAGGGEDLDEMKWDEYKKAFILFNEEEAEKAGSYAFQIADIRGGKLAVVPRAVFAAAAMIQDSREELNLSEEDLEKIKTHIGQYYAKMRREFDDDTVQPPWEKDSLNPIEVLSQAALSIEQDLEKNAGRVLSGRNLSLVKETIQKLQKLLEAAEPADDEQSALLTEAEADLQSMEEKWPDMMIL